MESWKKVPELWSTLWLTLSHPRAAGHIGENSLWLVADLGFLRLPVYAAENRKVDRRTRLMWWATYTGLGSMYTTYLLKPVCWMFARQLFDQTWPLQQNAEFRKLPQIVKSICSYRWAAVVMQLISDCINFSSWVRFVVVTRSPGDSYLCLPEGWRPSPGTENKAVCLHESLTCLAGKIVYHLALSASM